MKFIDAVLENKASAKDIDDYIDKWHADPRTKDALHVYLGLSWSQYARWVEKPSDIWLIIKEVRDARKAKAAGAQGRMHARVERQVDLPRPRPRGRN